MAHSPSAIDQRLASRSAEITPRDAVLGATGAAAATDGRGRAGRGVQDDARRARARRRIHDERRDDARLTRSGGQNLEAERRPRGERGDQHERAERDEPDEVPRAGRRALHRERDAERGDEDQRRLDEEQDEGSVPALGAPKSKREARSWSISRSAARGGSRCAAARSRRRCTSTSDMRSSAVTACSGEPAK